MLSMYLSEKGYDLPIFLSIAFGLHFVVGYLTKQSRGVVRHALLVIGCLKFVPAERESLLFLHRMMR